MAAGFQRMSGDARRLASSSGSSRPENRLPMNTILCRNGPQCRRYQEGACNYNHDFSAATSNGISAAKKSFNVDSPSFTPTFSPKSANAVPTKAGISPKAINAAAFTPRGSSMTPSLFSDLSTLLTDVDSATPVGSVHTKDPSNEFVPQAMYQPMQQFNEFVPGHNFMSQQQIEPQAALQASMSGYNDPFMTQAGIAGLDGANAQVNPYGPQTPSIGGQQFFQDASSYKHPLNYHLYASMGPRRENLMAYQRSTTDFFIPDNLREDLQRKSEATLQVFANSTLPISVEYFHSLVALDTTNNKGHSTFGYPSWLYKATSSRDGHTYCLRRIEGFRLTDELAIRTVQTWKRVSSGGLVQIHDAFTGKWFNDSSLIVVTDYHPMAQTLAERHYGNNSNNNAGRATTSTSRAGNQIVPENDLWLYIVQIASALKYIHDNNLAAQTVIPSKVLMTSKNRLRLGGCGVLDIVQYESHTPLADLQRADLEDLGRLIVGIATRNQAAHQNPAKALEAVSRSYTERFRACLAWLLAPPPPTASSSHEGGTASSSTSSSPDTSGQQQQVAEYNINTLLHSIADKVVTAFDSTLHADDTLTSTLASELENGRLVRLMAKLNIILERPDISPSPQPQSQAQAAASNSATPGGGLNPTTNTTTNMSTLNINNLNQPSASWSETGDRYCLKLFRDYVFHQVDIEGRPVMDLGHILTCLNKLDAGIEERIQLVSRDEQNVFVVTYREVKRGFEAAWGEISKAASASGSTSGGQGVAGAGAGAGRR